MARLALARALPAALLAGAGTTALAGGFLQLSFVPAAIGGLPGPVVAEAVGGVGLIVGVLLGLSAIRRDEGPVPSVPAHVAFSQRSNKPLVAPPRGAPMKPARAEDPLDAQIREVTRRINRAGVMLGTGQLSDAAYKKYVEALKKQRGDLEAMRHDRDARRA